VAAENLLRKFHHVNVYALLLLSEDGTNPRNQGIAERTAAAMARIQAGLSFIEPEILRLPDGTIKQCLREEPGLLPFRRNLEMTLRNKPYVLSRETEEILASSGEIMKARHMLYNRTKSSDMRFCSAKDSSGWEVPVSFATYEVTLEESPDTTLRRNAFSSFTCGISAYKNVLYKLNGAPSTYRGERHRNTCVVTPWPAARPRFLFTAGSIPRPAACKASPTACRAPLAPSSAPAGLLNTLGN